MLFDTAAAHFTPPQARTEKYRPASFSWLHALDCELREEGQATVCKQARCHAYRQTSACSFSGGRKPHAGAVRLKQTVSEGKHEIDARHVRNLLG